MNNELDITERVAEASVKLVASFLTQEQVRTSILTDDGEAASRVRMAIVELANRITEGAR